MDPDYIRRSAVGLFDGRKDAIEKAVDEHAHELEDVEVESKATEVETDAESPQDLADFQLALGGQLSHDRDGAVDRNPNEDPEREYMKNVAFWREDEPEIEADTPEMFKGSETVKERLAEIKMVNDELESRDMLRRYVATESDVPGGAHIYEDAFGKYYYEEPEVDVRPSTIAQFGGEEAIEAWDAKSQVLKTVEFLSALTPEPMLDANTTDAAEKFLERTLVLTDDDPGSADTFDHEFKSQVAATISTANEHRKGGESGN